MANKKPKEKHKKKISFSLNGKILKKLDFFLDEQGITKRSKYIEKLIKEDMEKRGKDINPDF